MTNLLKKAVTTIVGLVLVLGWWTLRDKIGCGGGSSAAKSIPTVVWGGGGGTVTIEAEATDPASVTATFETNNPVDDKDHKFMDAWQEIAPGKHVFNVDVPAGVKGSVAVLFHDTKVAKVGSRLAVRVLVAGQVVGEESETLDKPLEPGYGMQVEVRLEDYATGKAEPQG